MSTLLLVLLVFNASAADPKKVKCPGPNGKVERYIYKDCGAQFELYSRDIAGGLSVDVGTAMGSAQASSTVVQLAMDEVNKELRTHYVAACTMATTDPCGPGMDAFQTAVKDISTAFPGLRERASHAQTPADAEAIAAAVRVALADAAPGALAQRVDQALGPPVAKPTAAIGTWDVTVEADSACNGVPTITRDWTIAAGASPDTYTLTYVSNDRKVMELRGTPSGDEVTLVPSPAGSYPWLGGTIRVDSADRLVGSMRYECNTLMDTTVSDYRVAGRRK